MAGRPAAGASLRDDRWLIAFAVRRCVVQDANDGLAGGAGDCPAIPRGFRRAAAEVVRTGSHITTGMVRKQTWFVSAHNAVLAEMDVGELAVGIHQIKLDGALRSSSDDLDRRVQVDAQQRVIQTHVQRVIEGIQPIRPVQWFEDVCPGRLLHRLPPVIPPRRTFSLQHELENSWSISERVSELLAERDAANALILPTFFVPRLEICGADLTKVTILEGVKQADGRRTFSLQQDLPLGQQRHRRRRPSRVSRPPQHAPGLPVWRDRLATGMGGTCRRHGEGVHAKCTR